MDAFWHWSLGGVAIATVVGLYALLSGRLLGVSSLYVNFLYPDRSKGEVVSSPEELQAALRALTLEEFGEDVAADIADEAAPTVTQVGRPERRSLFLVGIVLGAMIAALVRGRAGQSLSLGEHFTTRYGSDLPTLIGVLLFAGVLIGFGTRMAGGCTSGHGICGVARAERGSLLSTMSFWVCGIAVTWGVTWLIGALT